MAARHSFHPHGDYDARIDGRILVATVSGSWNIEMHHEANRQCQPLVTQLEAEGIWGCMVVVRDTLVSSLDVFEAGRQAVEANRGVSSLKALAWVIGPEVEGNPFLLPRIRMIYEGILDTDVFESEGAAKQWLIERLMRF